MAYNLTRKDLGSITDVEIAFSTDRLLPPLADIPDEFLKGNAYTRLADALFSNSNLPDMEILFREGFTDPDAPKDLNRCVRAHLNSFGPKHQHKIAGVGYLIAQVCDLQPEGTVKAA